jgi:hypothetical protein
LAAVVSAPMEAHLRGAQAAAVPTSPTVWLDKERMRMERMTPNQLNKSPKKNQNQKKKKKKKTQTNHQMKKK